MRRVICIPLVFMMAAGLLTGCSQTNPSPTATATVRPTTPAASLAPTPTSPSTAATPLYGGMLRIIHRLPPRGLYPASPVGASGNEGALETLLELDEQGNIVPFLATGWTVSPDAKSLTIPLRKGVKFHDGTDFNAAAVKSNLEARKAIKFGDLDNVATVDVVDDYTVRLNLSKFSNLLLGYLTQLGTGMSSPTAVDKLGKDAIIFNPVTTGPFRFVSYDKDVRLRYERFDGYWQKGRPYLDGMEFTYIIDPTTASLAFQRGEGDVMWTVQAQEGADLKSKGHRVYSAIPNTYILVPDSVNPDSPLSKKGVREAVEYAIDGAAIAKAVGYGYWEGAIQIATSNSSVHGPDLKGRPYDPGKAKQLLTAAGYPNGFKTTISARTSMNREAAVAIQSYLKEVGIEVALELMDTGRFASLNNGGWKNGFIIQFTISMPAWLSNVNTTLSSTSVNQKSLLRPAGWQDLLERAISATDAKTEKELSQQLIRMAYEEAFVIPFVSYGLPTVTRMNVRNPEWIYDASFGSKSPVNTWLSK